MHFKLVGCASENVKAALENARLKHRISEAKFVLYGSFITNCLSDDVCVTRPSAFRWLML